MKLNYKEINTLSITHNLPRVKKIKIKMLENYKNISFIENKLRNIFKKERVVSLNEIFTLNSELKLDIFYGTLTNKNDFYNYLISEIEYEEYDYLRSYLNINDRKVTNTLNTSKDQNYIFSLNAFFLPSDPMMEIEILKNDFNQSYCLPSYNLKFLNNKFLIENSKIYNELNETNFMQRKISDLENLKNQILTGSTIFLIGPLHTGKNYVLKNICDEIGAKYIKKDMNKFRTSENFISYCKKLEFFTPCVVNFKNSKKLGTLFSSSSGGENNYMSEIKEIIKLPRHKSLNTKLVFIFSFENSTEIEKSLNILSDVQIEFSLPDVNARMELIKLGFQNILNNLRFIFSKKFGEKYLSILLGNQDLNIEGKTNLYNHLFESIEKLKLFDIAKITVGYDIKEIKSLLKVLFQDYYVILSNLTNNKFPEFDYQYIKKTFDKLKLSRFKNEKTISSIPEVKWEDVGGLEHAKEDINDTIQLPLKYPKLFESKKLSFLKYKIQKFYF
jgi:hypothetical protein